MIEVSVSHRQGDFELEASFSAASGVTALFGPSGSGKTSLVQIIAGLTRADRAHISVAGDVWTDTEKGIFVPTHRRALGYVFQEGRLFPHLNVRQNLRYGRVFSRRLRRISEEDVIEMLGIGHLLAQRPATLSGGEKQRVAIGRALLADPGLMLMDEPLSALDRHRRAEIIPYIERIRDETGLPIIYVSHAIDEVARLARHVVLLEGGRVIRAGEPVDVLPDAAGLPDGLAPQSVLSGTIIAHEPAYGLSVARVGTAKIRLGTVDLPVGTAVRLRVSASDVTLAHTLPEAISALNHLEGTIAAIDRNGTRVIVRVKCDGEAIAAQITSLSAERLALVPGLPIHALFKAVTLDNASLLNG